MVENNNISDADDGVTLGHNANDVIVRNNNLHNNLEVGIHLEDRRHRQHHHRQHHHRQHHRRHPHRWRDNPVPANADDPPGTGNVAYGNTITGNTLGVANWDTQVFDASANWWGEQIRPPASRPL